MATDLYDKLSDINLLRRAWHLARNDSRTDFMFDPYRYSDFAFRLDDHLEGLSQSLASMSYHPNPILAIDVPKSSLSVRPGTVLAIEDKIVLFAIAYLVAPRLDKRLPPNVYSWRVKEDAKGKALFHDHEILKFPFLKRPTIQKRVDFVEPWYEVWPRFIQDLEYAYEKEGYRFLVVSDIVAYFENIDLGLLRDLLLAYFPKQPRIINFLIDILEHWTWPAIHGASAPQGIPQGNGVSSFLGNIYLLPMDQAFVSLANRRDIKYLRYTDDVKVLAKDMSTAREALFLMNDELRRLRLNIQGSKTRILEGTEIRKEFFDNRLEAVNEIIKKIQGKETLSYTERERYVRELKEQLRLVEGTRGIIRNNELRLFRRLMTGFTLLRHSEMVRPVLDQLERNPDERLLNSAVRYLRVQNRNLKRIAERLVAYLTKEDGLFPYQQAHFFMTLRYMRNIPAEGWIEARRHIRLKKNHWYVRQQAALLLGQKKLVKKELNSLRNAYEKEKNTEVKKALMQALAQLPRPDLLTISRSLVFSAEPKLQRAGRFYHGLLFDEEKGNDQVKSLFNEFREEVLLDRFFEVEVLSKARNEVVRANLLKNLRRVRRQLNRPLLKERIEAIIQRLQSEETN